MTEGVVGSQRLEYGGGGNGVSVGVGVGGGWRLAVSVSPRGPGVMVGLPNTAADGGITRAWTYM